MKRVSYVRCNLDWYKPVVMSMSSSRASFPTVTLLRLLQLLHAVAYALPTNSFDDLFDPPQTDLSLANTDPTNLGFWYQGGDSEPQSGDFAISSIGAGVSPSLDSTSPLDLFDSPFSVTDDPFQVSFGDCDSSSLNSEGMAQDALGVVSGGQFDARSNLKPSTKKSLTTQWPYVWRLIRRWRTYLPRWQNCGLLRCRQPRRSDARLEKCEKWLSALEYVLTTGSNMSTLPDKFIRAFEISRLLMYWVDIGFEMTCANRWRACCASFEGVSLRSSSSCWTNNQSRGLKITNMFIPSPRIWLE